MTPPLTLVPTRRPAGLLTGGLVDEPPPRTAGAPWVRSRSRLGPGGSLLPRG